MFALPSVLRCCLICLLLLAGASASAERLPLVDRQADIDAWPAAAWLSEADIGPLTAEEALLRLAAFQPVAGPHANLGVHSDAVWLHVPLDVPRSESGRWLLDIDYPSLDRVDVAVVTGGRVVQQATLGDHLLFADRPMPGRSHTLGLNLEPGQPHDLLLRVATTSSMIVPLHLMKPEPLAAREASVQMLQGLASGLGLCLMLYALSHWVSMRDSSFLYYALSVGGIGLFFYAYHGLGPQHLWGGNGWMTRNMAPLSVLLALVGGLPFLERTLQVRLTQPRISRWMKGLAWLALLLALAFVLGLIDYRSAHLASTVLGPMPIILGLPAAWQRMRRGDRAAVYVVAGWGLYAVGILIMAALLRGLLDVNPWTQHAFQAGAVLEMLMWMGVLGVRMDDLRRSAERIDREREALRSLAHTDPLTGLPNRRGLQLELKAALPRAASDKLLAAYLLDLDGFKAVNDRLGHDAGDELLKQVATRLRHALRARDVVTRLGGDEFVVLASDLPSDDAARRLGQKLLDTFATPFDVHGHLCQVGLTIGYALAPLDGSDDASLLKRADAAMYAGKQAGKHCLRRGAASMGLA
jgi:diguanylate cyclase (GGDEF)-like protein